jgi:clan AA aspartic protease
MSHESGEVTNSREARVRVRLASGAAAECVVDTGFDGALMLPRAFVERLQLPLVGRLIFHVVGGTRISTDMALAEVEWLGARRIFEVIVGESEDSLLGTEMLVGARLVIDYVEHTLIITNDLP